MFLLIPGLMLAVWFSVFSYVVVEGRAKGMSALLLSKRYVEGYWWAVLRRVGVLVIVMMIVGFGLGILSAGVSFALSVLGSVIGMDVSIVKLVMDSGTSVLIALVPAVYVSLVYEDLKQIKGDLPAQFSLKSRVGYLVLGLVGLLLMLVIPAGIILTAINPVARINDAKEVQLNVEVQTIQGGLGLYKTLSSEGQYPATLAELEGVVLDANYFQSANYLYDYQVLEDGTSYELCVSDVNQGLPVKCVGPDDASL